MPAHIRGDDERAASQRLARPDPIPLPREQLTNTSKEPSSASFSAGDSQPWLMRTFPADHADLRVPTAEVDQYRPRGRPSIVASPCRSGPVIRHAVLVTTWSSIPSAAHIRSSAASRSIRA